MARKALIGFSLAASLAAAFFVLNQRGDLRPGEIDAIRTGALACVLAALFLEGKGRIWLGMVVGFVVEGAALACVLIAENPGEPPLAEFAGNWHRVLGPPLYAAGVLGGFEAVLKGKLVAGVVGLAALVLLRVATGLAFPTF
ncbi:MAG: hypothetical protein ACUVYA_21385 [Planctomycetota bacterium]